MLAGSLLAPLITIAVVTPAHAECSSIPPDGDVTVTRKILEVGQRLSVDDKVLLSGFETGWVESRMNNLDCGDRDSLGVFRQRPSQGWGTPEQVRNVGFAANTYFSRAIARDRANPGFSPGRLAQSVQVSAYPDRYDAAEGKARQMMGEAFQPYGTIGDSGGQPGQATHRSATRSWPRRGARSGRASSRSNTA